MSAISVAMDMTAGIIDRFRTMAIARASVLTGHVIASVIQALFGLAVVLAVALALGFRSAAGPVAWLAAIGLRQFAGYQPFTPRHRSGTRAAQRHRSRDERDQRHRLERRHRAGRLPVGPPPLQPPPRTLSAAVSSGR